MNIAPVISISAEAPETSYAMDRYRMAYKAAKAGGDLADNVRYGGIFVACILVVAGLFVYQALPSERFEKPIVSGLLMATAVLIGLVSQIWGAVLSAQIRSLESMIDAAVHSSPFLTDDQRAAVMFFEQEGKKAGIEFKPKRPDAA